MPWAPCRRAEGSGFWRPRSRLRVPSAECGCCRRDIVVGQAERWERRQQGVAHELSSAIEGTGQKRGWQPGSKASTMIVRPARRSWVGYGEEPADQCNVVGPVGIGEEAVVTDAMKSVGQDMDQEAADELVGVEGHKLIASVALGSVILPFERDARAVEGDETAVGNSNPVRVARQVGEHSIGSAKRSLGIDDPFGLAQCGEKGLEGCRLGEGGLVGEELQAPGLVGGVQAFQEQAAEEA